MLVSRGERATIGSKAFDLYRCKLLAATVPKFYVIPTEYCSKRFDNNSIDELKEVLKKLGGCVAVRSSSVNEDTITHSNAGRFKTVLNVKSISDLIKAIRTVWSSTIDEHKQMAVIIQRQLHPKFSGVLFSRNPINGHDEVVIEYVSGLGEQLVSGKRTPTKIVIGNNYLENQQANLKQPFLKELIQTSKHLERNFGYPLDIEWAYCGKQVYILQARPITNLPVPPKTAGRTYSRVQAEQFYSGPVSPLFYSIFDLLYSKYYLSETIDAIGLDLHLNKVMIRHKNYLYVDTGFTEFALNNLPINDGAELLLEVFPEDMREDINRNKNRTNYKEIGKIIKFLMFNPKLWIMNLDRHFEQSVVPEIIQRIELLDDFKRMNICELTGTFYELLDIAILHIRTSKWGLALYLLPTISAMKRFLKKNGFNDQYLTELISGLETNKTLDASIELKKLAMYIQKKHPEIIKDVFNKKINDFHSYKKALEKTSAGECVLDRFELILKRYGHRRLSRDILNPAWSDEPMIPFSILQELVNERTPKVADLENDSINNRLKIKHKIEQNLNRRKRWVFRILSDYLIRYITFREFQRFYLDMILSKFRELILTISQKMVDDRMLIEPADIFFLDLDDITKYLAGKPMANLINKSEFNRLSFETDIGTPGRYLRGCIDFEYSGDLPSGERNTEPSKLLVPDKVIRGEGVSSGYFSGIARVVPQLEAGAKIKRGEILITKCIDPGQTHSFMLAGALVFEVGGILSHGAILAREFNLPTVAQVKSATSIFKTGQRLTVDGTNGEIYIESTE
jgi:pyruvate,water dikinase